MTEEINDNSEITKEGTSNEIQKKIGKFKSKDFKLVNFQKKDGRVLVHSEEALFDAKYLSGMLDGVMLKITICDEDTFNLEEVDTEKTDEETLGRLAETIFDLPITHTHNGIVLNGIKFQSVKPYKEKFVDLTLKVDISKPINDLHDILSEKTEVSTDQMDSINELLGDIYTPEELAELSNKKVVEDVVEEESTEENTIEAEVPQPTPATNPNTVMSVSIEENFNRIQTDKMAELNYRKEKKEEEISKLMNINKGNDSKIEAYTEDLNNLNKRIEAMSPTKEPNGLFFNVSEEKDQTPTIDQETSDTILKAVSKVKGINAKAFMEIFKSGKYVIKIGNENGDFLTADEVKEIELPDGVEYSYNNNELAYAGDLGWHELVDKFIKLGYSQDPEFEKKCESNSYINSSQEPNVSETGCATGDDCCGNGCHTDHNTEKKDLLNIPKSEDGKIKTKLSLLKRLINIFK